MSLLFQTTKNKKIYNFKIAPLFCIQKLLCMWYHFKVVRSLLRTNFNEKQGTTTVRLIKEFILVLASLAMS